MEFNSSLLGTVVVPAVVEDGEVVVDVAAAVVVVEVTAVGSSKQA